MDELRRNPFIAAGGGEVSAFERGYYDAREGRGITNPYPADTRENAAYDIGANAGRRTPTSAGASDEGK